ncbi:MAG TPA: flagellar biosynthesis anti-sigma factor FlgM [Polyangiales bacterium]|jgi:flagellar biosynthesis anti-sigma factor FlgM
MKVHGPNRPQVSQVQDKGQVKSSDAASSTQKSGGERVAVSSLSKLLSQVRAPEDAPDAAKVERLRDSIRTGSFKVDHQKVAEAMVQEEV